MQTAVTAVELATELAELRARFAQVVAGLDDAQAAALMANSGWTVQQMLRHVWSWEMTIMRAFDDWQGGREWMRPIFAGWSYKEDPNFELCNARMLEWVGPLPVAECIANLAAAYARFDEYLARDEAFLAEEGLAPWIQPISRFGLILDFVRHDRGHLEEIAVALGR